MTSPRSVAPLWVAHAKATTSLDACNASISRRVILDKQDATPTVCKACQNIFAEAGLVRSRSLKPNTWILPIRTWRGIGELHATVADLYQAADSGCFICDFVVEKAGTDRVRDYVIEFGDPEHQQRQGLTQHNALMVVIAYQRRSPDIREILLCDATLGSFKNSWNEISAAQSSTASPETLALAKRWLETCRGEHERCRRPAGPRWYPSRLLELRGSLARLIVTASQSLDEPYATLSHCWGKEPFDNLTSNTFNHFQKGIPIAGFLPSFRHAMEICLSLGIHLLWIDSFCIIQGQDASARADWEAESIKMEEVYANGCVNIAAACSSGPGFGCFSERKPCLPTPFIRCPASTTNRIALKKKDDELIRHRNDMRIQGEPLWSRAWVFQERLLSRRLLQFGAREIRWECRSSSATEFPQRSTAGLYGPRDFPEIFTRPTDTDEETQEDTKPDIYTWSGLVADYSTKSLTYPAKDKLRAFKAATDLAARHSSIRTLCGHSVHNFLDTLAWIRRRSISRISGIPSWSWASVDGPITYSFVLGRPPMTTHFPLAAIILPQYFPSEQLPSYGQNDNALFCIGRVLPVDLLGRFDDSRSVAQKCRVGTASWELDVLYDDEAEFEAISKSGDRLWLLAICPSFNLRHDPSLDKAIDGQAIRDVYYHLLVLMKRPDGTFRRFGIGLRAAVVGTLDKYDGKRFQGCQIMTITEWYVAYRVITPTLIIIV